MGKPSPPAQTHLSPVQPSPPAHFPRGPNQLSLPHSAQPNPATGPLTPRGPVTRRSAQLPPFAPPHATRPLYPGLPCATAAHPARLSRALSLPHGPEASAPARARQPLTARAPLSDPSPSLAQRPAEIPGHKSRRGSKPGRARQGRRRPISSPADPLLPTSPRNRRHKP